MDQLHHWIGLRPLSLSLPGQNTFLTSLWTASLWWRTCMYQKISQVSIGWRLQTGSCPGLPCNESHWPPPILSRQTDFHIVRILLIGREKIHQQINSSPFLFKLFAGLLTLPNTFYLRLTSYKPRQTGSSLPLSISFGWVNTLAWPLVLLHLS
jgi:hypothetical protein